MSNKLSYPAAFMVITKSNINNTESFGNIAESGTHTHFSRLPAQWEFRRSTSAKEAAQRWPDFPESQPSFHTPIALHPALSEQPHPPAALREPRGSGRQEQKRSLPHLQR